MKKNVQLVRWPKDGKKEMERLYQNTNQNHCLVRIPLPLPEKETEAYLNAIHTGEVNGRPFLCFGIEKDGEVIGKIEATKDEEGSAELDVVIQESYCDQGLGQESLALFLEELRNRNWCTKLEAFVNQENLSMIQVLEKNQFEKGRTFKADIVVPNEGKYELKEVQGVEYFYRFLEEC